MVRGDYTVHDMDGKPAKKDSSFRTCIVTMFIVFLLCVIIILIVWRVKPDDSSSPTGDSLGDAEYINDRDRKPAPPIHHATEPPETTTKRRAFVTTKKVESTTAHRFEKIKVVQSQNTTTFQTKPTTTSTFKTTNLTTTPVLETTPTTSRTPQKFDRIIFVAGDTTSVPRTTVSPLTTVKDDQINTSHVTTNGTTHSTLDVTTAKEQETTTVIIPPHILVVSRAENISSTPSITTDSTETTEAQIGGITTEDDSKTRIINTTRSVYRHVNDSSKTTPGVGDETDETTETGTDATDPILATTTPASTTKTTPIPLVILYANRSVSTTSDEEETDTSTSIGMFETTESNETIVVSKNSSNLVTGKTTVSDSVTTESDDESTTDSLVSQMVAGIIAVVNSTSTTVTDDNTETTTSNLPDHVDYDTTLDEDRSQSPNIAEAVSETDTTVTFNESTTPIAITTITPPTVTTTPPPATTTQRTPPLIVNETCQTSECKVLASRMLSLMNHSVDPCDNFYEFACGGLRDNPALLQDDPEHDIWIRIASAIRDVNSKSNPIHQKFRHFYDQCVDYEHTVNHSHRLELARKIVHDVDKMYNNLEWITANDNFNLTEILVNLFHVNSAPLFDVTVDVNHHDPKKFQLKLTVPRTKTKLQLESPSASRCKPHVYSENPHDIDMKTVYESSYFPCIRNFSEYLTTLEKAVKEMQLYDNTSAYNVSQDISAIKFFIEFDIFSSTEELTPWELRTNIREKKFKLITVEDLTVQYPELNWEFLFGALLNEAVTRDTEVQLYFEDYFDKLFGQLRSSLSNATARHIIHNGLLAMLAHDLYVDLVRPQPCNREEYCLRLASGLMEDVSSSLYLSTFTSKELSDKEHELITLFDQLKVVLTGEIEQASWLDDEARSGMVDKLHKMKVMADGGRAILSDPNYLSNQLSSQDLSTSNNYFENAIQLQRRYRKLLYYLVSYEADPVLPEVIWTFFLLPYDTHPISVYQLNTVVLPYGMIGSLKPTNKIPSFVWKARMGNIIARQIVHHFDSTGILYGPNGKDNDFLKDPSKESYLEAYEDCELNFDTYARTWTNQKNQIYHYTVNAARTISEHFTDNSALWLTHKLYNKSITSEPVLPWLERNHDELYLLIAAQEFCAKAELLDYTIMMFESEQMPPYLRAENMIVNSPVFGHIYNCAKGMNQNPNVKCSSFPQVINDLNHHAPGSIPVA